MHTGKGAMMVAVAAAMQSLCLAMLLLLSAYDGAREPAGERRLALAQASLAVPAGATSKQDGLRQILASDPGERRKARSLDPPDLAACASSCMPLPTGSGDRPAAGLAEGSASSDCCAFQPRAPPRAFV
ncbi:hypothetical protein [Rhizobium sp. SSA_523]|uniref:hypothetical protein n=2 Tax=Rhizobium sp. SSA_523 TaxID=2952477 RepID=UPI0025818BC6|nr:hypothetical protein [Rhizobium sp. SSA_523]MCO5731454.1 hypothetical protein [Rhizobium sp. SSA_523]WKC22024.1 hypothetical protein QTJ18_02435 [Rhizobium sp. SSA_523]